MADAAKELHGDNETADVAVSVDGTWQKKGFNSTCGHKYSCYGGV